MSNFTKHPCADGRGWSPDRVEVLQRLWKAGDLSASRIAERLGVSRNAVLGKVFRLGLSGQRPPAPSRPLHAAPRRRASRQVEARRIAPPKASPSEARSRAGGPVRAADTAESELPGLVARLEDLTSAACHWPCGDPKAPDFAFCGRRTSSPPYCAAHDRRAHRKGAGASLSQLLKLAVLSS
jgi:GcrA cell cycle regulator